jgi:hypothetical protein
VAELVDGLGVAVGDLSLAVDAKLPPGEIGAQQQDPAGQDLGQGGPGVVLELEPVGFQFDAPVRGDASEPR